MARVTNFNDGKRDFIQLTTYTEVVHPKFARNFSRREAPPNLFTTYMSEITWKDDGLITTTWKAS